jgi:hypothetical protein
MGVERTQLDDAFGPFMSQTGHGGDPICGTGGY